MCGIVAQHGDVEPESGARMLSRLTHRGPDDEGSARVGKDAWLGHRRLSIVDVSGGKQPLATPSGDLLLVGNGEVYNHEEVRETLSASRRLPATSAGVGPRFNAPTNRPERNKNRSSITPPPL